MKIYAGLIIVCWQTWKRRCKSTSNLAQVGQAASEDSSSRYKRDLTNAPVRCAPRLFRLINKQQGALPLPPPPPPLAQAPGEINDYDIEKFRE